MTRIISGPWDTRPQGTHQAAEKWRARGMRALFVAQPAGPPMQEVISGALPESYAATVATKFTDRGTHRGFNGTPYYASRFSGVFGMPATGVTLVSFVKIDPLTNSSGHLIKVGNNSTGYGIGVGNGDFDNYGTSVFALYEAVAWKATSPTVTVPSGGKQYAMLALRINADGSGNIYAPGIGSGTITASTPVAPSQYTYITGSESAARSRLTDYFSLQSAIFSSVLTDGELLELHEQPASLFTPRRIYIPTSVAAGGLPTLTSLGISGITTTGAVLTTNA